MFNILNYALPKLQIQTKYFFQNPVKIPHILSFKFMIVEIQPRIYDS